MSFKSFAIGQYARLVQRSVKKWKSRGVASQHQVFQRIIRKADMTAFGKDHGFYDIHSYEDFKKQVPIRDYEAIRPYIERIRNGERNVLWPGKPLYLAKTSGTTSGAKYIPITKDSVGNHFLSAQTALMLYMRETGHSDLMDGKMIFLSGSPKLAKVGGIPTGRLSGIVNHHIPSYLQRNRMPSRETNLIEDWETKLDRIVDETLQEDMRLVSGIPPWMQMYFDRLIERTGKPVKDIFPNFSVMVHGGVNFEPYRAALQQSIGKAIDTVETYPASEGFLAYQDSQEDEGLLLNVHSGIFFEFVPAEEIFDENPSRYPLEDVVTGKNYAVVLSSNAGLWAYNLGDTVSFTSLDPYKIKVTGRVKHFISAFGEHVISEEVEDALQQVAKEQDAQVTEFTVAPVIQPKEGLPYHEWLIEFGRDPEDLASFAQRLDQVMRNRNIYYDDLVGSGIIRALKITPLRKNAFIDYMRSIGKLGGQNKLPRLYNDRSIADELAKFAEVHGSP